MRFIRHIKIVLLAASLFLHAQCIKDSLDGCGYESGVILQLRYTDESGNDILSGMMTEAGIYIFNSEDNLVAGNHIIQSALNAEAKFGLLPGDYYALAWGNRGFSEPYLEQTISIHELYVAMQENVKYHYAPAQSIGNRDYSRLGFTVPERETVTRILDFMPVYLSVDVWVYGLDDEAEGTNLPVAVEVEDIPDGFDFFLKETTSRSKRIRESEYTLSPDGDRAAYAGFTLPYFYPGVDNELAVYLASDRTHLVTVNLLDFIQENGLTAQPGDHIEICIRFSGNVVVEIGIPDWSNTPVIPQV